MFDSGLWRQVVRACFEVRECRAFSAAVFVVLFSMSFHATATEDVAVYEAVFQSFGVAGQTFVVRQSPMLLTEIPLSRAEQTRLKAFSFNRALGDHQPDAFGSVAVRLMTDEEYVTIFADSKSCASGWESFRRQYSPAKGLIGLSKVGLSRKGADAVVLTHVSSACFGGTWDLLFFRRMGSTWRLRERVNVGRS